MLAIDVKREGAAVVVTAGGGERGEGLHARALERLVDAVESSAATAERLVLRSGGGRGLRGCGLDEYDAFEDRSDGIAHAERAARAIARLQRIEAPTVAVLEGAWLGEAFELALACDARVAERRARVGLPQPGIGVVPGWGGVQRLTERAGPSRSLSILCHAAAIPAPLARRFGVVDAVAEGPVTAGALQGAASGAPRWPALDRMLAALAPLRRMALRRPPRGSTALRPAVDRLPRLVEISVCWPRGEALEQQREAFAETVVSEEAKAIRGRLRGGGEGS